MDFEQWKNEYVTSLNSKEKKTATNDLIVSLANDENLTKVKKTAINKILKIEFNRFQLTEKAK